MVNKKWGKVSFTVFLTVFEVVVEIYICSEYQMGHLRKTGVSDGCTNIFSLLNTNIDGRIKIMYALTQIRGVGPRYSNLVCKKADVDLKKRAGELTQEELERIVTIMQNPTSYKIPTWFLNRQKDQKDGKDYHALSNNLESKLRDDVERLKKIRSHRGIRHFWGLKVRGQHTKTTSRGR